jgi:drug/metabolite transporter (DMT)-like permease
MGQPMEVQVLSRAQKNIDSKGPIAQLVRASGLHPEGQRFEPSWVYVTHMSKKPSSQTLGYLFVTTSATAYGLYSVFSNILVKTIDPLVLASAANLVAVIPLIGILYKQGKLNELVAIKHWKPILATVLLGVLGSVIFFVGTGLTSSIKTGLLLQIEPVYAFILSYLFLKERPTKQHITAVLIMIAGTMAVVWRGWSLPNIGDLLVLATPLVYQISHIVVKKYMNNSFSSYGITAITLLYPGLLMTAWVALFKPIAFETVSNPTSILTLVGFGLGVRLVNLIFWYLGLERLELSKAISLVPIAAAVSFVGSILLVGESPTIAQLIGLGGIILGLWWFSQQERGSKTKIPSLEQPV